jgi:hypothetical protein
MLVADSTQIAVGLMISTGVVIIAGLLAFYQWRDRRHRHPDLPEFEPAYFSAQDTRRFAGAAMLIVLAAGISVGSRIQHMVDGHGNLAFVAVWVAVMGLILVLLLIAAFDWMATRRYANRRLKAIARERLELLRDTFRRVEPPSNGPPADMV